MNTLLLTFLIACSSSRSSSVRDSPSASAPSAPPVAAATADEAALSDEPRVGTRFRLHLDPDLTSWDAEANTATFSPGSQVMSAHYTRYVLDLASLEHILGTRPTGPVDLVVHITARNETVTVMDDAHLPQPDGGFVYTDWTATVVGVAR